MKNILEVKNIGKKYQNKEDEIQALKNVNFRIKEGEFVSYNRTKWMRKIHVTINNCRSRRKKQKEKYT